MHGLRPSSQAQREASVSSYDGVTCCRRCSHVQHMQLRRVSSPSTFRQCVFSSSESRLEYCFNIEKNWKRRIISSFLLFEAKHRKKKLFLVDLCCLADEEIERWKTSDARRWFNSIHSHNRNRIPFKNKLRLWIIHLQQMLRKKRMNVYYLAT